MQCLLLLNKHGGMHLQDPSGTVTFFPSEVQVDPGIASTDPISVSVLAIKGGFTGEVPVTVTVGNTLDALYDGVTNSELVVYVEDNTPPEVLITSSVSALQEGSTATFQVALSTPPTSDVTMELGPSWSSGLPHGAVIDPTTLVFPAGESQVYRTVSVTVPYSEEYRGDSALAVVPVLTSDDPFYDSGSGSGAMTTPPEIVFSVKDVDEVGVCLANCLASTPEEMLFTGTETEPVPTVYEIITGQVRARWQATGHHHSLSQAALSRCRGDVVTTHLPACLPASIPRLREMSSESLCCSYRSRWTSG